MQSVATWTIVAFTVLVAAPQYGRSRCRSTCTDELRACRANCVSLRGIDRRACRQRCADASTCAPPGAPLPVLAYAVNECTEDAQGLLTLSQRLVVRRGNCDPVTAMTIEGQFVDPLPEEVRACRNYARIRIGYLASVIGRLQRIGVLADGSGVVFEVASYPIVPGLGLPSSSDDGTYVVRTNGSGLRRIGPPVGFGFLTLVPAPFFPPLYFTFDQTDHHIFASSPDGRRIAFTTLVPNASGAMARQIVVLDVGSGSRTRVTRSPALPPGARETCCPLFVDDRTLVFFDGMSGSLATVPADGSGTPEPIPAIEAVPGATVTPQFAIVSGSGNAYPLAIPGDLEHSYAPSDKRNEVFLLQGNRALQLTDLRYPDTGFNATLGIDRVTFCASANPIHPGTNPAGMCQLFSVPALGGPLRQLTHFPDDGLVKQGCGAPTVFDASCRISGLFQDLETRTILFASSCDPLGRTRGGEQVFAMRPDGTGLRQVTDFAGVETLPDGGIHVEMSGPFATSAALR